MSVKVSVVVPIYRVEKFLQTCIDSLLAQTLDSMELILVDDGSPDRSGEIADRYAAMCSNVQVIHQENKGLGPARNRGMAAATGEYIGFVDSDDWVKPEMYQRLYEAAIRHNADIVVSGRCDMESGHVIAVKAHPLAGQILSSDEEIRQVRNNLFGYIPSDRTTATFPVSACMSIYRRSIVEKSKLQFMEILSEDTVFNLEAYPSAAIIAFTDGTDYCYRRDGQPSITQTFSEGKILRIAEFLDILMQKASEEGEEAILRVKRKAIDYCRFYVKMVDDSGMSFSEKKAAVRRFAEHEWIRDYWKEYPVDLLPIKQRVFQRLIQWKQYGIVLMLDCVHHYRTTR